MSSWIVIAWMEETERFNPQTRRIEVERKPMACTWLRSNHPGDIAGAKEYVKEVDGGKVFVYDGSEKEPLVRARREIGDAS